VSSPELTIVMPYFNERRTVVEAIRQVVSAEIGVDGLEVLAIDDGSTDGSGELVAAEEWPPEVILLSHERNRGKGEAIRTALAQAQGRFTTVFDADLEVDPGNLPKLLDPLRAGEAEAVYGARGFDSHAVYSFWYVIGNRGVSFAANLLFNTWISDIMTCHKMMSTELFRSLRLRERGFGIEPEITARLVRAGVRIYEVPVTYRARSRKEGKKLTAVDGLRVLRTLLRCRVD
jgi:glycosyltransferase involved in cell wall biosynthesis